VKKIKGRSRWGINLKKGFLSHVVRMISFRAGGDLKLYPPQSVGSDQKEGRKG